MKDEHHIFDPGSSNICVAVHYEINMKMNFAYLQTWAESIQIEHVLIN